MERQHERQTCAVFDAQITNLAAIRDFVMRAAQAVGVSPEVTAAMIQAVDEAATNVIVHGYQGSPGQIEIELRTDGQGLLAQLRDDAAAFDPTAVPPPDLDRPLQLRRPGGLGVYLLRQFVDRMSYRRTEAGQNELTLEILAPARSRDHGAPAGSAGRARAQTKSGGPCEDQHHTGSG